MQTAPTTSPMNLPFSLFISVMHAEKKANANLTAFHKCRILANSISYLIRQFRYEMKILYQINHFSKKKTLK